MDSVVAVDAPLCSWLNVHSCTETEEKLQVLKEGAAIIKYLTEAERNSQIAVV